MTVATLAEEAEHTEAENIKLADRETKEEKKEQAALRKEYIESIRGNMRGQLNSILIKEKDGSITDLGKKYGGVTDTKN